MNNKRLNELLKGITDLFESMRKEMYSLSFKNVKLQEEIDLLKKEKHQAQSTPSMNARDYAEQFWKDYIRKIGTSEGLRRRYEFFVGYLYERGGWQVRYDRIVNPYGERDLICSSDGKILVLQCRDMPNRIMDGSFISQLATASLSYKRNNPNGHVGAVFFTSASFDDEAKSAARKFRIGINEQLPFAPFPPIKCLSSDDVYYTPYDMGYVHRKGDIFCWTPDEAEKKGFKHGK